MNRKQRRVAKIKGPISILDFTLKATRLVAQICEAETDRIASAALKTDALRNHPLPAHMLLMPGVLDSTTNFVEHPELVARRLEEAVSVVGDRERVIAGTDCGFGTFAGREYVAEEVVWVKLAAAAEGARIASHRLWGRVVG